MIICQEPHFCDKWGYANRWYGPPHHSLCLALSRRCPILLSLSPSDLDQQLQGLDRALFGEAGNLDPDLNLDLDLDQLTLLGQLTLEEPHMGSTVHEALGSVAIAAAKAARRRDIGRAAAEVPSLLLHDVEAAAAWVRALVNGIRLAAGRTALQDSGPDLLKGLDLGGRGGAKDAVSEGMCGLVLAKPSLLSIPSDLVLARLAHLVTKSGRVISGCDGLHPGGSVEEGQQVTHPTTTRKSATRAPVPELDGSGCVLDAVQRGPDLLAVTSCFVDRKAVEVSKLLQLKNAAE